MNDTILVLSYSERTSLELAKRIRGEQVFSLILPGSTTAAQIRDLQPKGIILSGEEAGSGVLDAEILELGVPVLAVGHTAHMMLMTLGGACAGTGIFHRKVDVHFEESVLFTGAEDGERYIREAQTLMLPANLRMTASGGGCTIAFEDAERRLYGIQFEMERHDLTASAVLSNFLFSICGCEPWFTVEAALEQAEEELSEAAKDGKSAVCAVSGGLDSTVAAVLAQRVFGDRMKAVFVETGMMRASEAEIVGEIFETLNIPLEILDAREQMAKALAGVRTTAEKQQIAMDVLMETLVSSRDDACVILGTDYGDSLFLARTAKEGDGELLRPLSAYFREDIVLMAEMIGLNDGLRNRKPFPPLGLGACIMGEIREEKLAILRSVDMIFREELRAAGLMPKLYDHYALLSESGAFGGGRQLLLCAHTLSGGQLMPARLPYDAVERTVSRIMEDHPSVTRVLLDETPAVRSPL